MTPSTVFHYHLLCQGLAVLVLLLIACSTAPRYTRGSMPSGRVRSPRKKTARTSGPRALSGTASFYGPGFHGKKTASGERFDMHALTAAHKTLDFGTRVRVTNLDNGKNVVVTINDRGPYKKGRIIDLSKAAAKKIGMLASGTAHVRLEVLR